MPLSAAVWLLACAGLRRHLPLTPVRALLQAMSSGGRQLQLPNGVTGSPDLPGDLPTMLSMDGFSDSSGSLTTASSTVLAPLPPVLGPSHGAGPGGASSLYIKGMPEDADKLWLYEKFARCACVCVGMERRRVTRHIAACTMLRCHASTPSAPLRALLGARAAHGLQVWRHQQRARAD